MIVDFQANLNDGTTMKTGARGRRTTSRPNLTQETDYKRMSPKGWRVCAEGLQASKLCGVSEGRHRSGLDKKGMRTPRMVDAAKQLTACIMVGAGAKIEHRRYDASIESYVIGCESERKKGGQHRLGSIRWWMKNE